MEAINKPEKEEKEINQDLRPAQGVYCVDEQGALCPIKPGSYVVDENGQLNPAVNWQTVIEKIRWEEAHQIFENWGKRGTTERKWNLVGMYVLTAIIIIMAGILAYVRIIEGQAIVGFLGAAIGYLLSKGRISER
jgi:hypothetical protein